MASASTGTVTINTGAKLPLIGLGTWRSSEEECYNAVLSALESGYKHIDTARIYENEAAVGRAINQYLKQSNTDRSELFITTKLWCTDFQNPEKALRESLERLGLDYVDLYLMHWPVAMAPGKDLFPSRPDGSKAFLNYDTWNYLQTYKLLQKVLPLGLTKAIGISNFNKAKIENLLTDPEVTVVPAALQIELHPYLPQFELVDYAKSKGISIEAYSPLGSTGAPVLENATLVELAKKYDVSAATVAISWGVQRDIAILPKSVNPVRVASNLKVIKLSAEDFQLVNDISKTESKRVVNPDWGVDIFDSDATFN